MSSCGPFGKPDTLGIGIPQFEHTRMAASSVSVVNIETQTGVEGFGIILRRRRQLSIDRRAHVRGSNSGAPGDRYRLYEIAGALHVGVDAECSA